MEMNAGWKALGTKGAWMSADSGELYLRNRFDPDCKEYEFHTELLVGDRIKLQVFKAELEFDKRMCKLIAEFDESVDEFVSEETVVKIMLITGRG